MLLKGTLWSYFLMCVSGGVLSSPWGRGLFRRGCDHLPESRKVGQKEAVQGSAWLRGLTTEYFYDQVPLEIETRKSYMFKINIK